MKNLIYLFLTFLIFNNTILAQSRNEQARCVRREQAICFEENNWKGVKRKSFIGISEYAHVFINRKNKVQNAYNDCARRKIKECADLYGNDRAKEIANTIASAVELEEERDDITWQDEFREDRSVYKKWCTEIGGEFQKDQGFWDDYSSDKCYCSALKKSVPYLSAFDKKRCLGPISKQLEKINALLAKQRDTKCYLDVSNLHVKNQLFNIANPHLQCPAWLNSRIEDYERVGILNYIGTKIVGKPGSSCNLVKIKDDPLDTAEKLEGFFAGNPHTSLGANSDIISKCAPKGASEEFRKTLVAEYYYNLNKIKDATLSSIENLQAIKDTLGVPVDDYFAKSKSHCGDPRISESLTWCDKYKSCPRKKGRIGDISKKSLSSVQTIYKQKKALAKLEAEMSDITGLSKYAFSYSISDGPKFKKSVAEIKESLSPEDWKKYEKKIILADKLKKGLELGRSIYPWAFGSQFEKNILDKDPDSITAKNIEHSLSKQLRGNYKKIRDRLEKYKKASRCLSQNDRNADCADLDEVLATTPAITNKTLHGRLGDPKYKLKNISADQQFGNIDCLQSVNTQRNIATKEVNGFLVDAAITISTVGLGSYAAAAKGTARLGKIAQTTSKINVGKLIGFAAIAGPGLYYGSIDFQDAVTACSSGDGDLQEPAVSATSASATCKESKALGPNTVAEVQSCMFAAGIASLNILPFAAPVLKKLAQAKLTKFVAKATAKVTGVTKTLNTKKGKAALEVLKKARNAVKLTLANAKKNVGESIVDKAAAKVVKALTFEFPNPLKKRASKKNAANALEQINKSSLKNADDVDDAVARAFLALEGNKKVTQANIDQVINDFRNLPLEQQFESLANLEKRFGSDASAFFNSRTFIGAKEEVGKKYLFKVLDEIEDLPFEQQLKIAKELEKKLLAVDNNYVKSTFFQDHIKYNEDRINFQKNPGAVVDNIRKLSADQQLDSFSKLEKQFKGDLPDYFNTSEYKKLKQQAGKDEALKVLADAEKFPFPQQLEILRKLESKLGKLDNDFIKSSRFKEHVEFVESRQFFNEDARTIAKNLENLPINKRVEKLVQIENKFSKDNVKLFSSKEFKELRERAGRAEVLDVIKITENLPLAEQLVLLRTVESKLAKVDNKFIDSNLFQNHIRDVRKRLDFDGEVTPFLAKNKKVPVNDRLDKIIEFENSLSTKKRKLLDSKFKTAKQVAGRDEALQVLKDIENLPLSQQLETLVALEKKLQAADNNFVKTDLFKGHLAGVKKKLGFADDLHDQWRKRVAKKETFSVATEVNGRAIKAPGNGSQAAIDKYVLDKNFTEAGFEKYIRTEVKEHIDKWKNIIDKDGIDISKLSKADFAAFKKRYASKILLENSNAYRVEGGKLLENRRLLSNKKLSPGAQIKVSRDAEIVSDIHSRIDKCKSKGCKNFETEVSEWLDEFSLANNGSKYSQANPYKQKEVLAKISVAFDGHQASANLENLKFIFNDKYELLNKRLKGLDKSIAFKVKEKKVRVDVDVDADLNAIEKALELGSSKKAAKELRELDVLAAQLENEKSILLRQRNNLVASGKNKKKLKELEDTLRKKTKKLVKITDRIGELQTGIELVNLLENGKLQRINTISTNDLNNIDFNQIGRLNPYSSNQVAFELDVVDLNLCRAGAGISTGGFFAPCKTKKYNSGLATSRRSAVDSEKVDYFAKFKQNDGDRVYLGTIGAQFDEFGDEVKTITWVPVGRGGDLQFYRPTGRSSLLSGFEVNNKRLGSPKRWVRALNDRDILELQSELLRAAKTKRPDLREDLILEVQEKLDKLKITERKISSLEKKFKKHEINDVQAKKNAEQDYKEVIKKEKAWLQSEIDEYLGKSRRRNPPQQTRTSAGANSQVNNFLVEINATASEAAYRKTANNINAVYSNIKREAEKGVRIAQEEVTDLQKKLKGLNPKETTFRELSIKKLEANKKLLVESSKAATALRERDILTLELNLHRGRADWNIHNSLGDINDQVTDHLVSGEYSKEIFNDLSKKLRQLELRPPQGLSGVQRKKFKQDLATVRSEMNYLKTVRELDAQIKSFENEIKAIRRAEAT